jgi:GTP-binding protein HflX
LLHIVDAADPSWEAQLEVTRDVLAEIGAAEVPSTLVMNKVDLIDESELKKLQARLPDAWFVSARAAADVASVRERIIAIFEAGYEEIEVTVPYDRQGILSEMHDAGRVLEEKWEEPGVLVRWRADNEAIGRIRAKLLR